MFLLFLGGNVKPLESIQKRNDKIIQMDLLNKTGNIIDAPQEIGQKIKVFGSSCAVFGNHTLIFLGGSLPPQGVKRYFLFFLYLLKKQEMISYYLFL